MSPEVFPFRESDRFALRRRLGAGAFGVVYEAYDRKRNSPIAIKLLKDPSTLLQFKTEFRALADLQHSNLVRLHELASDGDQWYFTMELVDGTSFRDYVSAASSSPPASTSDESPTLSLAAGSESESSGSLPVFRARAAGLFNEKRLRDALLQLAEGVTALHNAGILHRDLKPSNVLVTPDGRVVLLDFGLVAEMDEDSYARTMHVVGTPAYMSPEQGSGLAITTASDWYAVGVMLFEAITGQLPFQGKMREMLRQKRHVEAPPADSLAPGIPSDLNSLCRDLLRTDPETRPAGAEILQRLREGRPASRHASAASGRRQSRPFVGRESHMAALHDAYREAQAGRAVVVLLHGVSGIGKTTLVRRLFDDLQHRDPRALVLAGRCYERESVPYQGFDSLMDALCRYLQTLSEIELERLVPRDVLALAKLFPVLLQVRGVTGRRRWDSGVQDSQELRRRAFGAQRELLARLADQRPVALFIDDLQWSDTDTAGLLAEILRPPDPPAVLLIASFRSDERDTPVVQTLLNLRRAAAAAEDSQAGSAALEIRELPVGELSPESARDLVLALARQEGPIETERAEAIARESGGSPIFIDELVRTAREDSPAQLSLDDAIFHRVSRLPDDARRMLEVLAVARSPVRWSACGEAAGVVAEARAGALDVLRAERLVRSHKSETREDYEVYHARVADSIAGRMSETVLKGCHRRVAMALESAGEADAETLYVHWRAAGELQTAARRAGTAAAQAYEALAFDRAARLYRAALELGGPALEADAQRLWSGLGHALHNAGRGDEAADAYLQAAQRATLEDRIDLERCAAEALLRSGHVDRGLEVVKSVLRSVGLKMPRSPKTALLGLVLRRLQVRLRGLRYQERSASALAPRELLRLDTCWSVSVGLGMVDTIRAAYFQVRHLLLALNAGEPMRVARALAMEVTFSANAGGRATERTALLAQQTMELSERVAEPQAIALAILMRGIAFYLEGNWSGSLQHCDRAEEILLDRCAGVFQELDSTHHFQLRSLFFLGEIKQLARRLPALLKDADDRGDLYGKTMLAIRNLYIVHLAAGQEERARQESTEAIKGWSQQGFHNQHYVYLCVQTEIDLYRRDGAAAWKRITEGWDALTKSLLLRVQFALLEATHLRARCALAAAADGMEILVPEAEKAAAVIEKENMPWANPLARTIRAAIAAGAGRPAEAISLLEKAEQELLTAEMRLYAAAARRRRGELSGGESGRALIASADEQMAAQDIVDPARIAAMLLPGRFGA